MSLFEGVVGTLLAKGGIWVLTEVGRRESASRRRDRFSEEIRPVAAEFNETIGDRIKERAEEISDFDLHSVALHWDAISEKIDAYEVALEDEEEAVDWLVDEVTDLEEVELNDVAQNELGEVLAEEYANAVEDFRERIHGEEHLVHELQIDLQRDVIERLDEISEGFREITRHRPYDVYRFPTDREAVVDALLPGDPPAFIDRSEVPTRPEPGRHFVLGPSGSGKSRIIAERIERLPEDAVSHVLLPQSRMLTPSDARGLANESFDGDVLLVWNDVHRIDEGRENAVLERTLRELDHVLASEGHTAFTLLEARSGRLRDIPGNLPTDFENPKSIWRSFDPIRVRELGRGRLARVVERMAESFDVSLDEGVRNALVDRTVGSKSAPVYIETALVTADERLTLDNVKRLPRNVDAIWRSQYDDLRKEAPSEWRVLGAMKLLYDLNVPYYSKLVRAVYLDVFDGDRALFRSSVQGLVDRQWLTVVGEDAVDTNTRYDVHDTQIEPVRVRATDDARQLSTLLLGRVGNTVPSSDRLAAHLSSGVSFYNWGRYALAAEQWEAALDVDPQNAKAHFNYGLLFHSEFDDPDLAERHYSTAIDLDREYAKAHYNYALLLENELDDPRNAATHFETALDIDPDYAKAHYSYSRLLNYEFDMSRPAEDHYETAIELEPELAEIHPGYLESVTDDEAGSDEGSGDGNEARAARSTATPLPHGTALPVQGSSRVVTQYREGLVALRDGDVRSAESALLSAWEFHDMIHTYSSIVAGVWCKWLPSTTVDEEVLGGAVGRLRVPLSPVVSTLATTDTGRPLPAIEATRIQGRSRREYEDIEMDAYRRLRVIV